MPSRPRENFHFRFDPNARAGWQAALGSAASRTGRTTTKWRNIPRRSPPSPRARPVVLIAGIAQACGRIRVCVVRHNFPRRPVLRARPWGSSADLAAGRDTSLAFMRRYISVQAKTLGRGGEAQTAVLGVAFLVGTLFWAVMRWPAAYRPLDRQSSGRCGAARVRGLKSDNRTQRTRTRRFETARFVRLQIDPKINNLGRGNGGTSIRPTRPTRSKIRLMNRGMRPPVLAAKRPDSDAHG